MNQMTTAPQALDDIMHQIELDAAEAIKWAKANRWEVRGIHYSPRLSRDSNAFAANIYLRGVLAGEATDDGNGGCIETHLFAPVENEMSQNDHKHLENFINHAVDEYINNLERTKTLKSAQRSCKKKGHVGFAYKWNGDGLSYIGLNPNSTFMAAHPDYTLVQL